jgi:hypothetical protein
MLMLAACGGGGDVEGDGGAGDSRYPRARNDLLALVPTAAGTSLARVDRLTLRPLSGRRVALGPEAVRSFAFSPRRDLLAVGNESRVIRVVRTRPLEALFTVSPTAGGFPAALAWPTRDRLLALVSGRTHEFVVIDARTRRVLARHVISGSLQTVGRSARGLVALFAPAAGIGSVRLVAVDARGGLQTTRLARILAGFAFPRKRGELIRQQTVGLALAPDGRRAIVVPAEETVADVDLETMKVSYRELSRPVSLLGRLRNWLEPPAQAKAPTEGFVRRAAFVGSSQVAVTGTDFSVGGGVTTAAPAGLQLIDAHRWRVRTLDDAASEMLPAGRLLLVFGGRYRTSRRRAEGIGLRAYSRGGDERFHLFGSRLIADVEAAGHYAYVRTESGTRYHVVDLARGKIEATIDARPMPLSSLVPDA